MLSYKSVRFFLLITAFLFLISLPVKSFPLIVIDVSDTTLPASTNGSFISIYVSNYEDIIAGYQFELVSTNPELVTFDGGSYPFDTTGTLSSGFDYISASITKPSDNSSIQITALADFPGVGGSNPGIQPQQGGVLIRIAVNTTDSTEGLTNFTSTIKIQKRADFANPQGELLGLVNDTIIDSTYYLCLEWVLDSCFQSDTTNAGPDNFDFVINDTTVNTYIDTTLIVRIFGSVTIDPNAIHCDNNYSGMVDISDLVCVVEFMFGDFNSQLCPTFNCDLNNSGMTDISDLTYLVNYLFFDGPPPF